MYVAKYTDEKMSYNIQDVQVWVTRTWVWRIYTSRNTTRQFETLWERIFQLCEVFTDQSFYPPRLCLQCKQYIYPIHAQSNLPGNAQISLAHTLLCQMDDSMHCCQSGARYFGQTFVFFVGGSHWDFLYAGLNNIHCQKYFFSPFLGLSPFSSCPCFYYTSFEI